MSMVLPSIAGLGNYRGSIFYIVMTSEVRGYNNILSENIYLVADKDDISNRVLTQLAVTIKQANGPIHTGNNISVSQSSV